MEWVKSFIWSTQTLSAPVETQLPPELPVVQAIELPQKVITIDGGGMRGLYTVIVMQAVQDRLSGSIADHVDVLTGTSTGSIISFGLATGKKLTELGDFYKKKGSDIFYQSAWEIVKEGDGLTGPKYDPSKLEQLLQENFKDIKLSHINNHHVMAFATDVTDQKLKIFDSKLAQQNPQEDADVWFSIRASTAAPTYFPPAKWNDKALCDGGLVANNPSLETIIQLKYHYGPKVWENLKIISFGTGNYPTGFTYSYAESMGLLKWAVPISDTIMKSTTNMADISSARLLSEDQLVRLNGLLPTKIELDDYSPKNIQAIENAALTYIKNNPELIDKAAKALR